MEGFWKMLILTSSLRLGKRQWHFQRDVQDVPGLPRCWFQIQQMIHRQKPCVSQKMMTTNYTNRLVSMWNNKLNFGVCIIHSSITMHNDGHDTGIMIVYDICQLLDTSIPKNYLKKGTTALTETRGSPALLGYPGYNNKSFSRGHRIGKDHGPGAPVTTPWLPGWQTLIELAVGLSHGHLWFGDDLG